MSRPTPLKTTRYHGGKWALIGAVHQGFGRHEKQGISRRFQEQRARMAAFGHAGQDAGADFPQDASGKAIPYGIYDMSRNEALVNVGRDHDTPAFAVASIRRWWSAMGKSAYRDAQALFITADAGGSNGYRSRAWKHELQKFADATNLRIHVSHFPPGTSKWNKIEHRLFCHITQNWRGKPLRTFETIVDTIGNTRTPSGMKVKAQLDKRTYPTGVVTTKAKMETLSLHAHEFHGEWNYELRPRTSLKGSFDQRPKHLPMISLRCTA